MSALTTLAKMLGVKADDADTAMRSESGYRAALSRRNLFAAGAALAAGSVLVGGPLPLRVFHDGCTWYAAHSWADYRDVLKEQCGWWSDDDEDLTETIDASIEEPLRREVSVCWDPVDQEITDSQGHSLRGSFGFWAQREGRGILFGTEY